MKMILEIEKENALSLAQEFEKNQAIKNIKFQYNTKRTLLG